MKKLVISLLLVILGTSVLAQDKVHCSKNNKTIEYYIDSTDSEFYKITIYIDSCSSTMFIIPSVYYQESDSIYIKIKNKIISDSIDDVQASYCYSIGENDIALYLHPTLFPIAKSGSNDFLYSIELFYQDDKKYWEIRN